MNIIPHGPQILVAASIHDQTFVPPGKQMAEKPVAAVEAPRVSAQKPFHAYHEVGLGRLDHEVKMVAHQTIHMHLPAGFEASLRQRFKKAPAINVVLKDGLPSVTSAHEVVDRPAIFQTDFARHLFIGPEFQDASMQGTDAYLRNRLEWLNNWGRQ